MPDALTIVLHITQAVLFLTVAVFSYKIYQFNRLSKAWLGVTVGLVLLAVNQLLFLLNDALWIAQTGGPFVVAVVLTWGMHATLKQFESFSFVEREAAKKIEQVFKKL
jgi:hypothetical protein